MIYLLTKIFKKAIIEIFVNVLTEVRFMSQKENGQSPTKRKKFLISETNAYIPLLERNFLRLRQLNECVQQILSDLGIDSSDLNELDLLKNCDDDTEATYEKLIDLKLYLSAIQDTVRHLSTTGCLIDSLDQGKVTWPADHEDLSAEIFWAFGDKKCRLITSDQICLENAHLYDGQTVSDRVIGEE